MPSLRSRRRCRSISAGMASTKEVDSQSPLAPPRTHQHTTIHKPSKVSKCRATSALQVLQNEMCACHITNLHEVLGFLAEKPTFTFSRPTMIIESWKSPVFQKIIFQGHEEDNLLARRSCRFRPAWHSFHQVPTDAAAPTASRLRSRSLPESLLNCNNSA